MYRERGRGIVIDEINAASRKAAGSASLSTD
jgi:hypothetical protein